jgi:hypothetical protein
MPDRIAEYQAAVVACLLARALLHQHDLPSLLRAIEHSEAVAPILDPTLYREKAKAMGQDRDIIRAAMALWRFTISADAEARSYHRGREDW